MSITKGERISVLGQDHYAYEDYRIIDVVIMGNAELYQIIQEKDEIYSKPEFTEKDGMIAAKLEERFAELDGWNAETDAIKMLVELGISESKLYGNMSDLEGKDKVKVLLAKALFRKSRCIIIR